MTERFVGIQVLRFIAAMLVVVMHSTQLVSMYITGRGSAHYWAPGSSGVDIFFVISGFVMATSTAAMPYPGQSRAAAAWVFLKRRLLRIVPLYWFYTLLKAALLLAVPTLALTSTIDAAHLASSLLFLPTRSPWGLMQPVMPVGWTLNFEMLFYAVFAIGIALGAPRARFCLLVFLGLFLASHWFPAADALGFYAQTIVFEFVAGVLLARVLPRLQAVPATAAVLLMAAAALFMLAIDWAPDTDRLATWGLGATVMVACALALEPWFARSRLASRASFLGDASYSIYLSHPFVGPPVVLLLARLGLNEPAVFVVAVCIAAAAAGCVSYVLVERPMTSFFKRALFRPRGGVVKNA